MTELTFNNQDPNLGIGLDVSPLCHMFLYDRSLAVVLQRPLLRRAGRDSDKESEG